MKKCINIKNKKQKYYFGQGFEKFCKNYSKDWCKSKEAKKEKKKYKRLQKKWAKQRKNSGFDDSELWNLDYTIASFILPRLKRFKKITISYPTTLTEKQWDKKLDKMIIAFELILKKESYELTEKEWKKIKKGLKTFAKYFNDLWI